MKEVIVLSTYIGENIMFLRKRNGNTQIELAKHLYTTKQNIYKYEKGKITPPVHVLLDIAEFFGVPLEDLIRFPLSNVMDEEIRLDSSTINKYPNILNDVHLKRNIAYKFENRIFFKDMIKKNAVFDAVGDFPTIEYIDENDYYDRESFKYILSKNYSKELQSAVIHYTDAFIRVDEMDVIANSVGTEMDYKESPSSLKLKIENDFLAHVKLLAHSNTQQELSFSFHDTLLSMIYSFWELTLTGKGYKKVLKKLNELLQERFGEPYNQNNINGSFDEMHFYGFIKVIGIREGETIDELYERFNKDIMDSFTTLIEHDLSQIIDKINNELFGGLIDINIEYNRVPSKIVMNGFYTRVVEAMKDSEAVAYYNYLIGLFLESEQFNEIWDEWLDKYLFTLELDLTKEDIYNPMERLNNKRTQNVNQYEQFLRTSWVTLGRGYLDSKTVQLIKYYLTQEIKKKM